MSRVGRSLCSTLPCSAVSACAGTTLLQSEFDCAVAGLVAMQLTGHKTRAVFERYNIVSPGDLREAARRLDAFELAASKAV